MSEKVCSHHKKKKYKLFRRLCSALLILGFLVLVLVLIVFAVLQPKKPRFILQDATVFALNVSAPNILSTTIQITIVGRNPNSRIGIYYDKLYVYGNYNNQQITYFTVINPTYQGHRDLNIWSPFIYGNNVPIAPFNGLLLTQDQSTTGIIRLNFKIDGRLKWKVGTFVSARYRLHVSCPVSIPLGGTGDTNGKGIAGGGGGGGGVIVVNNNNNNNAPSSYSSVKYQLSQSCSVSV